MGISLLASIRLTAGEMVRFSDGKSAPALPGAGGKLDKESPLNGLLDKESSVGGITALPFSAAYQRNSQKPLTAKEKELLGKKSDWINRTPSQFELNEETAAKALGVRSYGSDDPKSPGELDLGAFSETTKDKRDRKDRVEKQRQYKDRFGDPNRPDIAGRESMTDRDARTSRDGRDGFRDERPGTERLGDMSEANKVKFSDPLSSDTAAGPARDVFQEALMDTGFANNRISTARTERAEKEQAQARRMEFDKMLIGKAEGNSVVNPLGGPLDPANTQPDLTQLGLNPVQPANGMVPKSPLQNGGIADAFRAPGNSGSGMRGLGAETFGGPSPAVPLFPERSSLPDLRPKTRTPAGGFIEMPRRNI